MLVGRNKSKLQEPADAVKSLSNGVTQALALSADISKESEVESVFKQTADAFGKVDVVAHAAGSMGGGAVGDLDPTTWFNDYEINVKGTYILAHYFIKAFGGEGTFISLVSLGVSFTLPGMSSYSGSKMGVVKLAEYLDAGKKCVHAQQVQNMSRD